MKCWWCCHEIHEDHNLPFHHDDRTDKFKMMGHFCSWECMKAWNLNQNGINRGGVINELIMLYKKRLCGKSTPTKCAPSRYHLKIFGGNLTIEEFRKSPERFLNCIYPILHLFNQLQFQASMATQKLMIQIQIQIQ